MANPGKCKDCKWWNDEPPSYVYWRECKLVVLPVDVDINMLARVISDDPAALFTHEDFGCVQFEKKAD